MCGITGYYNYSQKAISTNKEICNMLEVQRHRGPDDSGIRFFTLSKKISKEVPFKEPVSLDKKFEGVLGFNRLSILDLSKNGHQPMTNIEKDVILTLNGEIYNAFDFKDELVSDGFRFKSTSDTEVVLYLYLKYGWKKMLNLLNGMFAIVIVDLRSSEVKIARDRFGIKPMYYFDENGTIGFSSEIKSFYQLKSFKPTLNKELLDEYLIFRNTRNETLINEVKILPPGYSIVFGKNGKTKLMPFFNINNYQRDNRNTDLQNILQKVEQSLKKSVKRQLISDVKLGSQLSGGVDSSVVTYLAKEQVGKEHFETVSIIFDNAFYSEEKYIDRVAGQLGVEAHKFKMDADFYLNHLKKATWHLESPINHPNTIGIFLLAKEARKYVTVLLSGEGADEVFGGYSRYHLMKYRYGASFWKGLIKNYKKPFKYLKKYQNIALQAISGTAFMPLEAAARLKPDFDFTKSIQKRLELYHSFNGSIFDKQVKYEIATYIPDLLIRQDKMSMAHSIENRVPFLDNEVVAQSFDYSEQYMIRKEKNHEKFLLKEVCTKYFGKDFAYRDKMGFGIPLRDFYKDKKFKNYLKTAILPGLKSRKLFDERELEVLFSRVDNLKFREMETLWVLITLEIWLQEFIAKK